MIKSYIGLFVGGFMIGAGITPDLYSISIGLVGYIVAIVSVYILAHNVGSRGCNEEIKRKLKEGV